MARLIACAVFAACALLSACVPSRTTPGPTRTIYQTFTRTRPPTTPTPSFTPPAAHSVAPLPPGSQPARGEVEKACPYIASTPGDGPINVADIIGSHVLRTTVLTTTKPVGCRFYFYAGPFQAIADIVPRTFATARAAHQAMVLTGVAGSQALGRPNLVPGVDAVLYRTTFFGPDGPRDWACAFAAGRTMVIVHSQQDDTSYDALQLAKVVAPKFG